MSHHCHAAGCNQEVPPRMFACRAHWYLLPESLRRAIWREYNEGQEVSKTPTASYMAVQQCAVAWLAHRELTKRPELRPEYDKAATNAVMYETIAREQGKEPLRGLPRVWETKA